MRYKVNPLGGQELRQIARKMYSALNRSEDPASLSAAEVQHVLEDLAVSKIEQELQNEHLQDMRAKLEQALTQTVEMFDFAAVALFSTDAGGVIAKANFAGAQMLGMERAKLVGQAFAQFFAAAQHAQIQLRLRQQTLLADSPRCVLTLLDTALPVKQVQMSVNHLSRGSSCIITLTDVTQERQLDTRLQELRQQFRLLLEMECDGLWNWDVGSAEVSYSEQLTQLYGYSTAEFGHTLDAWRTRVHPDDQSAFLQASKDCLAGRDQRFSCEQRVQCKDGSWKWIVCRGAVQARAPDGKVLSLTGTHTDITERRQKESRALERCAQQTAALDALDNRIALLNGEGTILQTNAAWKSSLVAPAGSSQGQQDGTGSHFAGVLAVLMGADAEQKRRAIGGTAEVLAGSRSHYRQGYSHGDGPSQRWYLMEAVRMQGACALISHQDITRAQRELLQSLQEQRFEPLAQQEMDRAQRYGQSLTVLSLGWTIFPAFEREWLAAVQEGMAQALERIVRQDLSTSDLLGRSGPHAFAIVLPDTTLEGGEALAQRFVDQMMESPVELFGMAVPFCVSVGACLQQDDASFGALLKRAEAARREVSESRGYGVAVDPAGTPSLW